MIDEKETLKQEAEESIAKLVENHNKQYRYYRDNPSQVKYYKKRAAFFDSEATAADYCIFIRPGGYAVIHRKAFDKLSARDRKKLMAGCTFAKV